VWQVLYEELKDQNFEMVAVALDAGGQAAVEPWIRCTDLAERPDALRTLMGWSEEAWSRTAPPTYTCLIDEEHHVADLCGIKNVPEAVWIDEQGRIVRPAEPAGFGDNFRQMDPETFNLPEDEITRLDANRRLYWDAIRDWVHKGSESRFALSPEEVRAKLRRPSEEDVRAAAHARIGHHLLGQGDNDAAKRHFQEAVRLCPGKWNYRRQSMVLDPELIGELNTQDGFYEATAALGGDSYYDAIDMPGIQPDPLVSGPTGVPPA
jgi:hypothetical protein